MRRACGGRKPSLTICRRYFRTSNSPAAVVRQTATCPVSAVVLLCLGAKGLKCQSTGLGPSRIARAKMLRLLQSSPAAVRFGVRSPGRSNGLALDRKFIMLWGTVRSLDQSRKAAAEWRPLFCRYSVTGRRWEPVCSDHKGWNPLSSSYRSCCRSSVRASPERVHPPRH
jgi:hypothetical protein